MIAPARTQRILLGSPGPMKTGKSTGQDLGVVVRGVIGELGRVGDAEPVGVEVHMG